MDGHALPCQPVALDAVRKPAPRARREARGGAADGRAAVSRTGLSPHHAERRRRAAEHHKTRALQLLSAARTRSCSSAGRSARSASTTASREIAAGGGTGLAKLRKLIVSYAEVMTTDYGKSLVRFDVRDLTEHNRKIVQRGEEEDRPGLPRLHQRRHRRRLDQAVRCKAFRLRDRRLAELDRPLVPARRRAAGGRDRRANSPSA